LLARREHAVVSAALVLPALGRELQRFNNASIILYCKSKPGKDTYEHESDCWVAVCLDFNLASQGDSFGKDKPYAAQ
jgi:hypothetical protein